MPFLDRDQIAVIWAEAGGDPDAAAMAAAVALAESGGNPRAYNPHDGRRGLWQAPAGLSPESYLHAPANAAREAIARSRNGQDWSKFSAYTMGLHSSFLAEMQRDHATTRRDKAYSALILWRAMNNCRDDLIREALSAGVSRQAIADALGITRQHTYDIIPAGNAIHSGK